MKAFTILPLGWFGPQELLVILLIVLVLFGGKKIPELMRGLGGGIKEFKKAVKEEDDTPVDNQQSK